MLDLNLLCFNYNYERIIEHPKWFEIHIQGVPRNMSVGKLFRMSSSIICKAV